MTRLEHKQRAMRDRISRKASGYRKPETLPKSQGPYVHELLVECIIVMSKEQFAEAVKRLKERANVPHGTTKTLEAQTNETRMG